MAGSTFGTLFRVTTWGESHGKGIGAVVDGVPAGIPIDEQVIQRYLDRRKPGQSQFTTQRKERDQVQILSGIFEGKTTGTPIAMEVRNEDQHSNDYKEIASYYRPGHADFTFDEKYGFRDYRGGGRSSGRETIGRVAAGAIACEFLKMLGISILAYSREIGGIRAETFEKDQIERNAFRLPDELAAEKVEEYLKEKILECDSVGGVIECVVSGLPKGLGEPVFDKLDANLAKAMLSIGAVKGFEIGDGFASAKSSGSVNNDAFIFRDGKIVKETNHAGGVLGGMSDGSDLMMRIAIKPTPSIARTQQTVKQDGTPIDVVIKGRHDPIIVPRAVVVVEAMTALVLADALLINMSSRVDRICECYKKWEENR